MIFPRILKGVLLICGWILYVFADHHDLEFYSLKFEDISSMSGFELSREHSMANGAVSTLPVSNILCSANFKSSSSTSASSFVEFSQSPVSMSFYHSVSSSRQKGSESSLTPTKFSLSTSSSLPTTSTIVGSFMVSAPIQSGGSSVQFQSIASTLGGSRPLSSKANSASGIFGSQLVSFAELSSISTSNIHSSSASFLVYSQNSVVCMSTVSSSPATSIPSHYSVASTPALVSVSSKSTSIVTNSMSLQNSASAGGSLLSQLSTIGSGNSFESSRSGTSARLSLSLAGSSTLTSEISQMNSKHSLIISTFSQSLSALSESGSFAQFSNVGSSSSTGPSSTPESVSFSAFHSSFIVSSSMSYVVSKSFHSSSIMSSLLSAVSFSELRSGSESVSTIARSVGLVSYSQLVSLVSYSKLGSTRTSLLHSSSFLSSISVPSGSTSILACVSIGMVSQSSISGSSFARSEASYSALVISDTGASEYSYSHSVFSGLSLSKSIVISSKVSSLSKLHTASFLSQSSIVMTSNSVPRGSGASLACVSFALLSQSSSSANSFDRSASSKFASASSKPGTSDIAYTSLPVSFTMLSLSEKTTSTSVLLSSGKSTSGSTGSGGTVPHSIGSAVPSLLLSISSAPVSGLSVVSHEISEASLRPTAYPSPIPSHFGTASPMHLPTPQQTACPSVAPTVVPTEPEPLSPTAAPTATATLFPSVTSTRISLKPVISNSLAPSSRPESPRPSVAPSAVLPSQSGSPIALNTTVVPTIVPTALQTLAPTILSGLSPSPSVEGTTPSPTLSPSVDPTVATTPSTPSCTTTTSPTADPSAVPTEVPSATITVPSVDPTANPTTYPSAASSMASAIPSAAPSVDPSADPSSAPSVEPTAIASAVPSTAPSVISTMVPSAVPTTDPTAVPSVSPSFGPTASPSVSPSPKPTAAPSTSTPTVAPTSGPTTAPSTASPTALPSADPTASPSTAKPSASPSTGPTVVPSAVPTYLPGVPTPVPSAKPTTALPSSHPTNMPTSFPSGQPTGRPSMTPSSQPSSRPSAQPSIAFVETMSRRAAVLASQHGSTSSFATQVLYTEGLLQGTVVYGGCSTFQSAGSQLYVAMLPGNLHVTSIVLTDWPLLSPTFTNISCITNADAVVSSLYGATTSVQNTTCNDHIWRSRKCSNDKVALCIDCLDPCATDCSRSFALNPCSSQISTCSSAADGYLRKLSVTMMPLSLPPSPSVGNRSATSTKAMFTVKLSSSGTFYVGLFGKSTAPTATGDIISQGMQYIVQNSSLVTIVTLSGLIPSSAYSIYLLTVSSSGVVMSFSDALSSRVDFMTACCRPLTVTLSNTFVTQNSSLLNGIALSIQTRPDHNFTAYISVNGSTLVSTSLSPAQAIFSVRRKYSTSSLFSLLPTSTRRVDILSLHVILAGIDASIYRVVYSNGNTIQVLSASHQPAPPEIQYARFSDDGSSLIVGFTSSTDLAGISAKQFSCNRILNFTAVSQATCVWTSSSLITVNLGSGAVLAPGDRVSVVASRIRAACPDEADCSHWNTTSTQFVLVGTPLSTLLPVVSIRAPSLAGICDKIVIDTSSSSGSAGRSWSTAAITVQATSGSVGELQKFFNSTYKFSPPTAIPSAYLYASTFTFTLTLCNFLGGCSFGSAVVSVVDAVVPMVTIFGSPVRQQYRKSPLSIQADAFEASCNSTQLDRSGLIYQWSVTNSSGDVLPVVSTSKQRGNFGLGAFSLLANQVYTITLTATDSVTFTFGSASVQVSILSGALVAVVSGGSSRGVTANSALSLDASNSYDEDVKGLTGEDAGLSFSWSCLTTLPVLLSDCSLSLTSDTTELLTLSAGTAAIGTVSSITVTVFDSTRSVSSSVSISVLVPGAPVVTVASTLTTVFNPGDKLFLFGSVAAVSSCECSWSIDDTSLDISSLALGAVSKNFALTAASSFTFNLALGGSSLAPGAQYSFELLCEDDSSSNVVGFASVKVLTNSPPSPGLYEVSPNAGTELQDTFTLAASQWIDTELPLTYSFGFLSSSDVFQLVQSQSQLNYGTTVLPAGLDSANYSITCVGVVYDALTSNSSVSASVRVTPFVGSFSALQSLIAAQVQSALGGTVDQAKQAISTCSASLNSVSCSSSPNCTVLSRQPCRSTANTCGPCIHGFVGESGDSNSKCSSEGALAASSVRRLAVSSVKRMTACVSDDDCGVFEACKDSTCVIQSKNCSDNCNSKGTCVFILSAAGTNLSTCALGDPLCEAVCFCDDGYGGPACEYTTDDLSAKQTNRASLLQALADVTESEDSTETNVAAWLNSVASLAQSEYELSMDALKSARLVAATVCSESLSLGLDYSAIDIILSVVDSLNSRVAMTLYVPTFEGDADDASDISQSVVDVISSFGAVLFSGMILDQTDVQYSYDSFNLVASVSSITAGSNSVLSASEPLSSLQLLYSSASQATLSVTTSSSISDIDSLRLLFAVVNPSAYGLASGAINSNSLLLLTDNADVCTSATSCSVSLVAPNIETEAYLDGLYVHVQEFFCHRGVTSSTVFSCPNGFNMTGVCDGVLEGWVNMTCPHQTSKPSCALYSDGDVTPEQYCQTVSYDGDVTTCECSLTGTSSRRRRLLMTPSESFSWSSQIGSSSGAQFVTVTEYTTHASSQVSNTYFPTSMPTSQPSHAHGSIQSLMGAYALSIRDIILAVFIPVVVILLVAVAFLGVRRHLKQKRSTVGIENLKIDWEGIFKKESSHHDVIVGASNPQTPGRSTAGPEGSSSSSSSDRGGNSKKKKPVVVRHGSSTPRRPQRGVSVRSLQSMGCDPLEILTELDEVITLNADLSRQTGQGAKIVPARVKDLRQSCTERQLRQAELAYLRRLVREYQNDNDRLQNSLSMSAYLSNANNDASDDGDDGTIHLAQMNSEDFIELNVPVGSIRDANQKSRTTNVDQPQQTQQEQGDDEMEGFHRYFNELNMQAAVNSFDKDIEVDTTVNTTQAIVAGVAETVVKQTKLGAMLEPQELHHQDEYANVSSIFQSRPLSVVTQVNDRLDTAADDDHYTPYDMPTRSWRPPPPRPSVTSGPQAGGQDVEYYRNSSARLQRQHESMLARQAELQRLTSSLPSPLSPASRGRAEAKSVTYSPSSKDRKGGGFSSPSPSSSSPSPSSPSPSRFSQAKAAASSTRGLPAELVSRSTDFIDSKSSPSRSATVQRLVMNAREAKAQAPVLSSQLENRLRNMGGVNIALPLTASTATVQRPSSASAGAGKGEGTGRSRSPAGGVGAGWSRIRPIAGAGNSNNNLPESATAESSRAGVKEGATFNVDTF